MKTVGVVKASSILASCVACVLFSGSMMGELAQADEWMPGVADSAQVSGAPIAHGKLRDSAGRPFAAGSHVVLFAYPRPEVMSALAIGDSVSLTPITKAVTQGDGSYELKIDKQLDLAKFTSEWGTVDMSVQGFQGGEFASRALSASSREIAGRQSGDIQDSGATDATSQNANLTTYGIHPDEPGATKKTSVCGYDYEAALGNRSVVMGQTYARSNAWNQFVVQQNGTTDLGVGMSISGSYGTWSQSGTASRGSSSEINFGQRTAQYIYSSQYRYGKYAYWCYDVYSDYAHRIVYSHEARPLDNSGIAGAIATYTSAIPAYSAANCGIISSGVSMKKTSSNAVTYSTGASLKSTLGVDLSSKTGFSSSTAVTSMNVGGGNKQICGYDGPYDTTPKRIAIF